MDWLSYSPADLVPFSWQAWLDLLGRYNQNGFGWLAAGSAMTLGAVLLLRAALGPPTRRSLHSTSQPALALCGLFWLWISWAFFHRGLGTLLWAADWLAWGFAAQGLALLIAAALPPPAGAGATRWRAAMGWGLLGIAVVGLPLLAWATGQPWRGIGWFGSAPTPTAVGTLGLVLILPPRLGWLLLPVPLLWCLLASLLGQVLGDPLWPLPAFCALCGLLAGFGASRGGPVGAGHGPR